MAKNKISKKTGIIMSKVEFKIIGDVSASSLNVRVGDSAKGTPYAFADFVVNALGGHKIKIEAGGYKQKEMCLWNNKDNKVEKVKYKKDLVVTDKDKMLLGVNYKVNGEKGTKDKYDFANAVEGILEDGKYFIKGEIEFDRFKNNNGDVKVSKKLKMNGLYPEDSEEELHHFDIKNFLFTGMADKTNDKGKVVKKNAFMEGFILGYGDIFQVRFEINDEAEGLGDTLANKKMVKPYSLMSIVGEISNKPDVEDAPAVTPKKGNWGSTPKAYKMATGFSVMKLTILSVDPSTINHGAVTEKDLMEAIKKTNDVEDQYNSPVKNGNWGKDTSDINLDKKVEGEEENENVEKDDTKEEINTEVDNEEVDEKDEDDDFFDFDDE